jgi:hypothetical protein
VPLRAFARRNFTAGVRRNGDRGVAPGYHRG